MAVHSNFFNSTSNILLIGSILLVHMPRTRRLIRAQRPYELILRIEKGIPFVSLSLIKLLIEGIIARAQRDQKVTICHYLWMGNHVHMILIARDAQHCVFFYQEIQKKITDSFKRLLGKDKLRLWEGEPVLAEILDPDAVVERISYLYANPASADLVESIDDYPGLSTWNKYVSIGSNDDCTIISEVPWIQLPSIKVLPSSTLSRIDDVLTTSRLRANSTIKHELRIDPNAWFACFKINDSAAKYYLERIVASVRNREQEAKKNRNITNKKVLGKKVLQAQPILQAHTPKNVKDVFMCSVR